MPVVLHDRTLASMAVGPLDHFFNVVHETSSIAGVLAAGPMTSVEKIAANTSFSTLLLPSGVGPNSTLFDWGSRLMRQSGKSRPDPYKDSFVLSHLGYWVDNGAVRSDPIPAAATRTPAATHGSVGLYFFIYMYCTRWRFDIHP